MIDTSKMDQAEVLAALYNNLLQEASAIEDDMTVAEARAMLDATNRFQYINGWKIELCFDDDGNLDASGYDKIFEPGEAQRVIDKIGGAG